MGLFDKMTEQEYEEALTVDGDKRRKLKAVEDGFTVVVGAPDLLLLDLDDEAAWVRCKLLLCGLSKVPVPVHSACWWVSKSGTGKHVVVKTLGAFTAQERQIFEVHFGSDPIRAIVGIKKIENGILEPSALFRPKNATSLPIPGYPLLDL